MVLELPTTTASTRLELIGLLFRVCTEKKYATCIGSRQVVDSQLIGSTYVIVDWQTICSKLENILYYKTIGPCLSSCNTSTYNFFDKLTFLCPSSDWNFLTIFSCDDPFPTLGNTEKSPRTISPERISKLNFFRKVFSMAHCSIWAYIAQCAKN